MLQQKLASESFLSMLTVKPPLICGVSVLEAVRLLLCPHTHTHAGPTASSAFLHSSSDELTASSLSVCSCQETHKPVDYCTAQHSAVVLEAMC
jgi:hypothetical protein